jgi:hypothetical protein
MGESFSIRHWWDRLLRRRSEARAPIAEANRANVPHRTAHDGLGPPHTPPTVPWADLLSNRAGKDPTKAD